MTTIKKETISVEVPVGVKLVELDYYNTNHKRGFEPIESGTDDERAYLYLEQKAYHLINNEVFGDILTKIGHDQLEDVVQDFEVVYDEFGNEVSRKAVSLPRYGVLYYAKQAVSAQINFYIKNGILEEWKRREEVSDGVSNFTMSNDEYETILQTVCKEAWSYAKGADILLQALNFGLESESGAINSYGLLGRFKDTIETGLTTGDFNSAELIGVMEKYRDFLKGYVANTDEVADNSNYGQENLTQALNISNARELSLAQELASLEAILSSIEIIDTKTQTQPNWPTNTQNLVANTDTLLTLTNADNEHIKILASTIILKKNLKRLRFTGSTSADLQQTGNLVIKLELWNPNGTIGGIVEIENIRIDQQPQAFTFEFMSTRSELMILAGLNPTIHTDWTDWTIQLVANASANGTIGTGGNDDYLSIETSIGGELVGPDSEIKALGVSYDNSRNDLPNNVQGAIDGVYDFKRQLKDGEWLPQYSLNAIQLTTGGGDTGFDGFLNRNGKLSVYNRETGIVNEALDTSQVVGVGAITQALAFETTLYTDINIRQFQNTIITQFGCQVVYNSPRSVKLVFLTNDVSTLKTYKLTLSNVNGKLEFDLSQAGILVVENIGGVNYQCINFNDTAQNTFTSGTQQFSFTKQASDTSGIPTVAYVNNLVGATVETGDIGTNGKYWLKKVNRFGEEQIAEYVAEFTAGSAELSTLPNGIYDMKAVYVGAGTTTSNLIQISGWTVNSRYINFDGNVGTGGTNGELYCRVENHTANSNGWFTNINISPNCIIARTNRAGELITATRNSKTLTVPANFKLVLTKIA